MAADERRASIIEATLPLLRSKGQVVSTKEISKAAGIAEGTIFRVFDSKDELIRACIGQAFETSTLRKELQAIDPDLTLAERLTTAVELMQGHLKGVFSLMMTLQATGTPMQRPAVERHQHDRQRSTQELDEDFEELIAPDRHLLRVPPATVVDFLRMATLASVHPFFEGRTTAAADLVDLVLEGSLARPGGDATPPSTQRTTAAPIHRPSRGKK